MRGWGAWIKEIFLFLLVLIGFGQIVGLSCVSDSFFQKHPYLWLGSKKKKKEKEKKEREREKHEGGVSVR